MRGPQSLLIRARLGGEDGKVFTVNGRAAWALNQLMQAGDRGLTPVSNPAPRWSHYVWLIRAEGVAVETVDEPHAGAFAGSHARYVLRSQVEILERSGANALRPPAAPLPAGAPLPYESIGGAA